MPSSARTSRRSAARIATSSTPKCCGRWSPLRVSAPNPRLTPGVHRLVGVHVLAVAPQHLRQRRGPGQSAVFQRTHGGHLPDRAVASGAGTALDDAEKPVAYLAGDAPPPQPVVR